MQPVDTLVPVRPWTRRERWLVGIGALVAGLVLAATANPGPALVNDPRAAVLASWSLGSQGELALPEVWPASANYWGVATPDGRVHVNRFPGVAYWAAPAYALQSLLDDAPPPAHPYLVDARPAGWTAALTVLAALLVGYALLRDHVSRRWAASGVGLLGAGTAIWSVAADALWPHGPAAFALLTVLWGWRRDRPGLTGAAAVVAVLVRPHLAVALLVIGGWGTLREPAGRRAAVATVAGVVTGIVALAVYSRAVFGTWLPAAGYDVGGHLGGLLTHSPGQTLRAFGLALVDRQRGAFVLSPVLVLATVAVVRARHRLPTWATVAALAGLLQLLVQVRAVGHAGGAGFFGARVSLESVVLATPAFVLATATWVRERPAVRHVAMALAAVSVAVHAYGATSASVPADDVERWRVIVAGVEEAFGDLQLGEVDLRRPVPGEN